MKRTCRANYHDRSCRAYADSVGCKVDSGLKNFAGYSGFVFQPQKSLGTVISTKRYREK